MKKSSFGLLWNIQVFFINNNRVYSEEFINQKNKIIEKFTEKNCKARIYSLENIAYQTLICEAIRFYINAFFEESIHFVREDAENKQKFKLFNTH